MWTSTHANKHKNFVGVALQCYGPFALNESTLYALGNTQPKLDVYWWLTKYFDTLPLAHSLHIYSCIYFHCASTFLNIKLFNQFLVCLFLKMDQWDALYFQQFIWSTYLYYYYWWKQIKIEIAMALSKT